jgi:hypothetical protein
MAIVLFSCADEEERASAGPEQGSVSGGGAGITGAAGMAGIAGASSLAGEGGASGSGGSAGGDAGAGSGGASAGTRQASSGGAAVAGPSIQPPGPPATGAEASGTPDTFAVRAWFLGDVARDGTPDLAAWRTIGWDLDSRSFAEPYGDGHCQPVHSAEATGYWKGTGEEGEGGIDNELGAMNGRSVERGGPSPTALATADAESGVGTLLIRMDHVGEAADYVHVGGSVRAAVGTVDGEGKVVAPSAEQWDDGSYEWHPFDGNLDGTGMKCTDATLPHVFPTGSTLLAGHVTDNVWVAGDFGPFVVPVSFLGKWLPLRVHRGWLVARLSADRTRLENGTVGGIIAGEDLSGAFNMAFGCVGSCESRGPTQLSDMMLDGTQDETKTCDGVSFAFGFEAVRAREGAPVPAPPPTPLCWE